MSHESQISQPEKYTFLVWSCEVMCVERRRGNICGKRDVCLDTDQLLANTDLRLDMYQLSVTFLPRWWWDVAKCEARVEYTGGRTLRWWSTDSWTRGMSYTNKHWASLWADRTNISEFCRILIKYLQGAEPYFVTTRLSVFSISRLCHNCLSSSDFRVRQRLVRGHKL